MLTPALLGHKMAETMSPGTAKDPASPVTPANNNPQKFSPFSLDETNAKNMPLHCIIESLDGASGSSDEEAPAPVPTVELDTYAILPGATQLSQVVDTALAKLGYAPDAARSAKGCIQLRQWRPLTFDTITQNPDATLDEILGDVKSCSSLRIRLQSKSKSAVVEDVREKLLNFLIKKSIDVLVDAGCPLEQELLTKLTRGDYQSVALSDDSQHAFERWYNQLEQTDGDGRDSPMTPDNEVLMPPAGVITVQPEPTALRNFLPRQRLRTSFDPDTETPKLQKWFCQNTHPSKELMNSYLRELNAGPLRSGPGKALELSNIAFWFKNTRAAARRSNGGMLSRPNGVTSSGEGTSEEEPERSEPQPRHEVYSPPQPHDARHSPASHIQFPILPNPNAVFVVPPFARDEDDEEEERRVQMLKYEDNEDSRGSQQHNSGNEMNHSAQSHPVLNITPERNGHHHSHHHGHHHLSAADPVAPADEHPQDLSMTSSRKRRRSSEEDSASTHSSNGGGERGGGSDYIKAQRFTADYLAGITKAASPLSSHYETAMRTQHQAAMLTMMQYMGHHPGVPPHALFNHPLMTAAAAAGGQGAVSIAGALPPTSSSPYSTGSMKSMQDANHNLACSTPSSLDGSPSLTSPHSLSAEDRKKRSRVFIDPLSEIPKLEKWFLEDTHPSSYQIEKYTEELNHSNYRQRFPRLEPKNVQLWFKNHRAKVKRTRIEQQALGAHGFAQAASS